MESTLSAEQKTFPNLLAFLGGRNPNPDQSNVYGSTPALGRLGASGNQPQEIARPCPNCGTIHWNSDLSHSSSGSLVSKRKNEVGLEVSGGIHSTLYGVCRKCADRHSEYYAGMQAAADRSNEREG